jgi:hypothetical protein
MSRTRKELSEGINGILSSLGKSLSKEQKNILKEASEFVLTNSVPPYAQSDGMAKAEKTKESENVLSLKWGTLKSYRFKSKKANSLLKEYDSIGASASAAMQNDTKRQKEIICELIDLCDTETIYLHWTDEEVSKEKAKQYVMDYGKEVDDTLRKVKVPKDRITTVKK